MSDDASPATPPGEAPAAVSYQGDMTTVARLLGPTQALLLKNCLQAAGVPAELADAHLVRANAFLTNAVGGVRVVVPADQGLLT